MDEEQYQDLCTLLDDILATLQLLQTQLHFSNTTSTEQRFHELHKRSLENYRQSYLRQFGHVEPNNTSYAEDEIE